jgi:predicted phosphodiesterase
LANRKNKGTGAGQKLPEPKQEKLSASELANLRDRGKAFDPTATKMDVVEDLRRVQEEHPNKSISRNFYRMHGTYSEKTWSRYFGTMEEFRSEAKLQLNRSGRKLEKDIARHASLDEQRRYYRLQIEPWVGKYTKAESRKGMVKLVVGSDFHDIEVDLFALNVFIDTCKVEQPDIIVLNGDIFDMYEFSRFDRDPRKINLRARFEFVHNQIFARLRAVCPNAQIDLIIGNHEHRILRHLAGASPDILPLLELNGISLAVLLGLDKYEINLVSKGSTAAFQPKEIRSEMLKNWKVYFNCLVCNHTGDENFGLTCISGHIHKPRMTTKVHVNTGPVNNVVTGCMCKPDADYTIRKTDWQLGFAIAYVDANSERVQVNNVLFNDNFVNVNGRYYFRDSEDAFLRDSAATAQGAIDVMKAKELQGFVNNDLETAEVAGLEKAKKAKAI